MFKKNENVDFFELFIESSKYSCEASEELFDLVKDFSNIEEKVANIKNIEHNADDHAHKIYKELNKAFITPIEREDILNLNHNLDNIVDGIEHVSRLLLVFNVKTLEPDIMPFVELVIKVCLSLKEALIEFKNFKKSKTLLDRIIEVNSIEEEGDVFYAEAVKKLFSSNSDAIHILKWYEIYEELEDCLDDCERVANIIEDVILKNT